MFKALFGVLQKIGRALMLPVAILPAAGILLALGNAMQNKDMIQVMHFLSNDNVQLVANVMESAGQIVFDNLPLLFAVGVAIGLANGDGVAGIAAIIGYLVMNVSMSAVLMANGSIPSDKIERAKFLRKTIRPILTCWGYPLWRLACSAVLSSGSWPRYCSTSFIKLNFRSTSDSLRVSGSSRLSHQFPH